MIDNKITLHYYDNTNGDTCLMFKIEYYIVLVLVSTDFLCHRVAS